jgi:DNA-binding transcriptional regulator PaaX
MKENAKRTLVWLYDVTSSGRFLTKTQIAWVLPDLTAAGLQSLLYQLEKKQLLLSHPQSSQIAYALTQHGSKLIEAEFPALSIDRDRWTGSWSMIVCLQAPQSDHNFRYLREYLLSRHCLSLTRGVFLYPDHHLPAQIQSTLETLYPHAVVVFSQLEWTWGDERKIIGQKMQLLTVHELLSGISKEIEALLIEKNSAIATSDQPKMPILSLFNRFFSLLKQDSGLGKHYFSQDCSARSVLADLQLLG